MSKKRSYSDGDEASGDSEVAAAKRQKINKAHFKKKRHHQNKSDEGKESLGAIKKRARAIERLLARDNLKLPANKQKELERELKAHKERIKDIEFKRERSKMISKYHMVRFFERRKALRFAQQLERRLSKATDPVEIAQLKADLHIAQVDIDYTKYFPFMEPYVSLYAQVRGNKEGDDKDGKDDKGAAARYLHAPRPPMWYEIEKIREEGVTALEKLQNRAPEKVIKKVDAKVEKPKKPSKDKDKRNGDDGKEKKKKERAEDTQDKQEWVGKKKEKEKKDKPKSGKGKKDESPARSESEESDSDGGFFEED